MTTLRTTAQQALSALELGYDAAKSEADQYHIAMAGYTPQTHARLDADVQQIAKAITALKAALAEPEGGGNLPPPLQKPTVKESLQVEPTVAENATVQQQIEDTPPSDYRRGYCDGFRIGKREGRIEAEDAPAEPEHEIIARMRKLRAEAEAEHRQALEQGRCYACMQELPEELKTHYQVNHDLPAGCDHCNHPLYAAIRCRVCGRDTDPLQKLADSEKRLGLDYIGGKE